MVWTRGGARRLRRRRPGDASPGAGPHPRARGRPAAQARVRAGCATSSSPSSCSSSCTDAADERLRQRDHPQRARRADRRWVRRPRGRQRACTTPTRSCAPSSTGSSCYQLRRTHVVPDDEDDLRRLGRSMGYLKDPVESLNRNWAHHRREVRRLHEKLFYRPLLAAVARIPGGRGTADAGGGRGPARPPSATPTRTAALRHLEALTAGVTRTAAIQRTLLPVMLEWFADAPDPDAGLFGFRRVSEALGRDPLVPPDAARRGRGRRAAGPAAGHQPLRHRPAAARAAGGPAARRGPPAARRRGDSPPRCWPPPRGRTTPRPRSAPIRAVRRRELFRIAAADLLGLVDVADVGIGAVPASPTPPSRRPSAS